MAHRVGGAAFDWLGAALLGWIAGGLIVGDVWVKPHLPDHVLVGYIGSTLGALAVILIAKFLARRRRKTTAA
jgi:membrane protein DedA with SNARE-associated domain